MVIIVKNMQKNKVKKIITYLFALWGMIVIIPSYA
ncbi:unnamed protein product [Commensalibacter communis]|nr:unnamed protein product [Commensalibacter communis]CAI3952418.1 unnamed protein product [Commensalibacter communis]